MSENRKEPQAAMHDKFLMATITVKDLDTLRKQVEELEGDIETSIGLLKMADKFVGMAIADRDRYRTTLEEIRDRLEADRSDEAVYWAVDIATTALDFSETGDTTVKCGRCGGSGIDSEGYSPGHIEMLPCPDCTPKGE